MLNSLFARMASVFRMDEAAWRRHANPWSVLTRFAAIPALILAVWSRIWIGWWTLLPVSLIIFWLWINPHVFPAVSAANSWASRGIYGEKLWLERRAEIAGEYRTVLRRLMCTGIAGLIMLAWGLWNLHAWATFSGTVLFMLAQLWRIDRLGFLYEKSRCEDP